MTDQQIYVLLFSAIKGGAVVSLVILVAIAAMKFTPSFPDDDGERM